MGEVWGVVVDAVRLWGTALALHPDAGAGVQHPWAATLLMVAAALVATFVGQSAVLVINRLRGLALGFALVSSFVGMLAFAALAAGLIALGSALVLRQQAPDVAVLTRLVLGAFAPLVFSFATVIPLLGPMIERLLQLWSLAIVWVSCHHVLHASGWRIGLMLLLVAAALLGLHTLISPWLMRLRDRAFHRLTGRHLHPSTAYLLELVTP